MQRSGATDARQGRRPAARIPALLPEPPPAGAPALLEGDGSVFAEPAGPREGLERALAAAHDEAARLGTARELDRLLLRGADQRVKNSLQLVISVLMMQAAAMPGRAEGRALVQAANRVQAIAHSHSLLHRDGGAEHLGFHDYLSSLCSDLRQSLLVDGVQRRLDLDLEPVEMRADCAVSLALIVNELVTNAFRHAFPDKRPGRVLLQVKRAAPALCRILVADDGIGLRSWKMRGRTSGLGARIVGAMVQQLGAKLEVASERGTRFMLEVPLDRA